MGKDQEKAWHNKISCLLSKQLSYEYKAFYMYKAASSYFDRRDIERPGLKRLYRKMAKEELEHADGIIDYMNSWGYKVEFYQVESVKASFDGIKDVIEKSLEFEKLVLKHLKEVYAEAEGAQDYPTTVFLEPYVMEQITSIKQLNGYLLDAQRCSGELGEFLFDKVFRKSNNKK